MPGPTYEVDVVDDTWIDAAPAVVGAVLAVAGNWPRWWPGLDLVAVEQRGAKGVRWQVRTGRPAALRRGSVRGSMEIWLQPVESGTVAHYFLRLTGTDAPLTDRAALRIENEYRRHSKRALWAVTDLVDPGRLARVGGPPAPAGPIP